MLVCVLSTTHIERDREREREREIEQIEALISRCGYNKDIKSQQKAKLHSQTTLC
jgi:hypothetical protein